MMEARALDFRLDPVLRAACDADIVATCGYALDEKDTVPDDDPTVTACLQDHRDHLTSDACRAAVRTVTADGADDARFDVGSADADPLADACADDRARLCAGVAPGSAHVVRCLQDARAALSPACAASLFDAEVRAAESIDFKLPLARACGAEAARACAGVPHEGGALQACLRHAAAGGRVSTACSAELASDARRAARDYRLNYRLKIACSADVAALCAPSCAAGADGSCGGRVLACLADKQDAIKATACRDEVFYFVKMQVADYRNDVLLAEACRGDVDTLCRRSKPGDVLKCLRTHRDTLDPACRREEVRLSALQSRDARLFPSLAAACGAEMNTHCAGVAPGRGRVVACLVMKAGEPDFGPDCRAAVADRAAEMASSYRNDFALAAACEPDAHSLCSAEASGPHADAAVLSCLVRAASTRGGVSPACAPEAARAARLALWGYAPGAALTAPCDADVVAWCSGGVGNATVPLSSRPAWSIGAVGRCLSTRLALNKPLTPACAAIVVAAAPDDAHTLLESTARVDAVLSRVAALADAAGLGGDRFIDGRVRGAAAVTLTGWAALTAVAALAAIVIGGTGLVVRRLVGGAASLGYTIVTKQGDV